MKFKAVILVTRLLALLASDLSSLTGLVTDSVVVITESSAHNRIAALTCLKKVIEEVENKHTIKYSNICLE